MSREARRLPRALEPGVALVLVTGLGIGAIVGLNGVATGAVPMAVAGGVTALAATGALLLAGWLDGLTLVALTLPLPAIYGDEEIRLAFVAPVAALVVLGWLLRRGAARDGILWGAVPRRALVALAGVLVITAAASQYPLTAARELINLGVLAGLLIAGVDQLRRSPDAANRLVGILAAVASVSGALAALEGVGVIPGRFPLWDSSFHRAALGFGQPNELGLFLGMSLPLVLHRYQVARTAEAKVFAIAGVVSVALGLTATFSRGSWLAVVAGAAALGLAGHWRSALRIWLWAAVAVLLLDVLSGGVIHERIVRTLDEWVVEQRAALMLAGVLMFLAHPLFGVGPGGFAPSLQQFGSQVPQLWDYLPTPHNAFVQMAAESGIFGLLVFIWFLGATLRALIRAAREPSADANLRRAVLWSFAAGCVACLVVWPLSHGNGEAFILIAAIGLRERR